MNMGGLVGLIKGDWIFVKRLAKCKEIAITCCFFLLSLNPNTIDLGCKTCGNKSQTRALPQN